MKKESEEKGSDTSKYYFFTIIITILGENYFSHKSYFNFQLCLFSKKS